MKFWFTIRNEHASYPNNTGEGIDMEDAKANCMRGWRLLTRSKAATWSIEHQPEGERDVPPVMPSLHRSGPR